MLERSHRFIGQCKDPEQWASHFLSIAWAMRFFSSRTVYFTRAPLVFGVDMILPDVSVDRQAAQSIANAQTILN